MQRSVLRIAALRPQVAPLRRLVPTPSLPAFASTKSAPKEAAEASAQSGGSRSKDFVEAVERDTDASAVGDTLGTHDARGSTGGGKPLESSDHPPPQPKIWNASARPDKEGMTDAQKEEVTRHNKEFDEKHDKADPAEEDKVDKHFWSSDVGKSVRK